VTICMRCARPIGHLLPWLHEVWVHVYSGGQVVTTFCDATGRQATPLLPPDDGEEANHIASLPF
jgi:hypothetical protein